eukprot:CAMPEP_0168175330 /NCGR_PEP_ID=MMETSP0139_2-20121125/7057_1 /TAXON_ID=44445 /ORGANISM="Pseudo-nitzschia australis, Strain 10249 10 AB" /LENGTH=268 /DNA_ID=CAMNT_0008093695 /DNA_START=269 /DNA_END=1075 /DNA_ORIENTATION=+
MTTEPNTRTNDSSSLSSSTNLLVPLGSAKSLDDCNENNDSNRISSDEYEYEYDSNPTVFGKILRGELATSRIVGESNRLLVFEDIKPRAPLHALVIPKQHIPSLFDLDDDTTASPTTTTSSSIFSPSASLSLLEEMNASGQDLVRARYPESYERGDYILCFHLPPFNSVDHLHLHVLAPASSMNWIYRNAKYHTGKSSSGNTNNGDEFEKKVGANAFYIRWCIGMEDVLARVRAGSSPTPYRKDDSWSTTLRDTFSSIGAILSSSVFG